MNLRACLPILLAACMASCLENEEEITIRPDGSAHVRMSAKSNPSADLGDGYPIPLDGAWIAADEATRAWIAGKHASASPSGEDELSIAVTSDFASVRDLPRFTAPANEPYRTAYLERTSELAVETRGAKRVYSFERTYGGREFERYDVWTSLERELPGDLHQRVGKGGPLTDAEHVQVASIAVRRLVESHLAFADDALLSIYTHGDASLPTAARERARDAIESALATVASERRVRAILDVALPADGSKEDDGLAGEMLKSLEQDSRAALRAALDRALAAEGVGAAARNGVRGELEWRLSAYDHTVDLADESFRVIVRMPGTVVGGNHDRVTADGAAVFEFEGESLRDEGRVLRVVSVVE